MVLSLAGCGGEKPTAASKGGSTIYPSTGFAARNPHAGVEGLSPSGAAPIPNLENANSKHQGDMHLALTTDKDSYRLGEKVTVNAVVTNLGKAPKDFTMWNIGDPRVYVTLNLRPVYEKEIPLLEDGRGGPEIAAVNTASVNPNETFTQTMTWNQTYPGAGGAKQIPKGKYTMKATIHMGKFNGPGTTEPLEVSRTIEIR